MEDTSRASLSTWKQLSGSDPEASADPPSPGGVHHRCNLFFEASRDAVLFIRRDGRILDANPAATMAYGYSWDELVTMSIRDLRAAGTVPSLPEQMERADSEGILFETVHQRKDGTAFPVEVSSRGADLDGQRVLVSVIRDITARKRAEDERDRVLTEYQRQASELDAIFRSIADAVVVYGPSGEIMRSNPAARRLLRYSGEDEALGLDQRMLRVRPEMADGTAISPDDTVPNRALRGEVVHREVAAVHLPDGRRLWVSASGSPMTGPEGDILGAVVSLTDITRLREMSEQRAQHVLDVSHGLRTPLTVIQGQAQLLERWLPGIDGSSRARRSAEALVAAARRMSTTLMDLVDLAELELERPLNLILRPVELHEFLIGLLGRAAGMMDTGRVQVRARGTKWVKADPHRLERVILNLLSNALEYSPNGAPVTVRLARRGDEIVTSVADRGRGIPQEALSCVFERHRRRHLLEERNSSLGLGLNVTKGLVESHGGRVWVESEPGKGACFSFSLPAARDPGSVAKGRTSDPRPCKPDGKSSRVSSVAR